MRRFIKLSRTRAKISPYPVSSRDLLDLYFILLLILNLKRWLRGKCFRSNKETIIGENA